LRIASDRTITVELTRSEAIRVRRLINRRAELDDDESTREDLYNGLSQHIYETEAR
jgi:hypothetical protein